MVQPTAPLAQRLGPDAVSPFAPTSPIGPRIRPNACPCGANSDWRRRAQQSVRPAICYRHVMAGCDLRPLRRGLAFESHRQCDGWFVGVRRTSSGPSSCFYRFGCARFAAPLPIYPAVASLLWLDFARRLGGLGRFHSAAVSLVENPAWPRAKCDLCRQSQPRLEYPALNGRLATSPRLTCRNAFLLCAP